MYLLVFIFLLMAIIGMHMQIFLLQAAKSFERQTAVAQMMVAWHKGAQNIAACSSSIGTTAAGNSLSPLSLMPVTLPAQPANIPTGSLPSNCAAYVDYPSSVTVVPCPYDGSTTKASLPSCSPLPLGYDFSDYKWYSIAYTPSGSSIRYIATFVIPPIKGSLPIAVPAIGLTLGQLSKQVIQYGVSPASYGVAIASGATCRSVAVPVQSVCKVDGSSVPLPSGGVVPDGAFVLITPY